MTTCDKTLLLQIKALEAGVRVQEARRRGESMPILKPNGVGSGQVLSGNGWNLGRLAWAAPQPQAREAVH